MCTSWKNWTRYSRPRTHASSHSRRRRSLWMGIPISTRLRLLEHVAVSWGSGRADVSHAVHFKVAIYPLGCYSGGYGRYTCVFLRHRCTCRYKGMQLSDIYGVATWARLQGINEMRPTVSLHIALTVTLACSVVLHTSLCIQAQPCHSNTRSLEEEFQP